jgi:maltose-binding protein MalE
MSKRLLWLFCLFLAWNVSAQGTPTPTSAPLVRVWLPDEFVNPANAELNAQWQAHTQAFTDAEGVAVELRLRRTNDVGGVLSTLRSASLVAPEALPDLTLMRYQDLLNAQREGLIQPMEGRVSSAIVARLGNALALGQVESMLYGLPYTIELSHLALQGRTATPPTWSYEGMLASGLPLTFSAGRSTLSDMFYAQYASQGEGLAVGGTLRADEDALLKLLTFYEQAIQVGVVDPSALNYTSQADYAQGLRTGDVVAGLVNSTTYLSLRADNPALVVAPIPTHNGRAASVMSGWMWVMVTFNPEQQVNAMRYLSWMLEDARHAELAISVGALPSQKSLFRAALRNRDLAVFYEQLLDSAYPPLITPNDPFIRALQTGLAAVMSGERTAQEALETILDAVEEGS